MHSDLRFPRWLSSGVVARLGFLRGANSSSALTVPCRLPGCTEGVERKTGRGRPPWFHDSLCSVRFWRRRAALDDAIEELGAVVLSPETDVRARREAEWAVRWFIVARSAYVAPTEWEMVARGVEDQTDMTTQLLEYWRRVSGRPAPGSEPCPMCDGTGDLSGRRKPIDEENELDHQRRVYREAGVGIYGHLVRVNQVTGGSPLTLALQQLFGRWPEHSYEQMEEEIEHFDPFAEKSGGR